MPPTSHNKQPSYFALAFAYNGNQEQRIANIRCDATMTELINAQGGKAVAFLLGTYAEPGPMGARLKSYIKADLYAPGVQFRFVIQGSDNKVIDPIAARDASRQELERLFSGDPSNNV